jgi:hypothetical protein
MLQRVRSMGTIGIDQIPTAQLAIAEQACRARHRPT